MPARDICLFPHSVLRQAAEPVVKFDAHLHKLIQDLIHTMKTQRHGIGIAAPQIGVSKQLAVVDVSARVSGSSRLILINPKIVEYKNDKISREGCMSVPDYTANLKRYDVIRLVWQDIKGQTLEKYFMGIEAVCIQHEVDHLEGVLFIDRVVSLKRDMIPRERRSKA